jgi:EAL domain-containing protein (putative c-di-GMP-specific phosphodiesterase class I)
MSRADVALYKAKDAGRGTFAFFEDSMTLQLQQEMNLTHQLFQALERDEFLLEYQPQFSLAEGRLVGAEALLRWRHPERGLLGPAAFLDVAEKRGLMCPIGEWVLAEVARQAAEWSARGLAFGRLSVNLCATQVNSDGFAERVQTILEQTGADPQLLELEYTETVLMKTSDATRSALHELSALGMSFAIDDFGTGFSSLMYLKQFYTDKLKIDREFVRDLLSDSGDAEIVKATIALGRALGLVTVAEGVEHAGQAEFLRCHGCDQVQGFLYARPMSPAALERRLES